MYKILIPAAILLLLAAYFLHMQTVSPVAETIEIPVAGLPEELEGFTILHLSDLHNAGFTERVWSLVNEHHIDLAVFTGDLLNSTDPDIERAASFLKEMAATAPSFAVLGNWDMKVPTAARELINSTGVQLLENRQELLNSNGAEILLAGVGDPFTGHDNLEQTLPAREQRSAITILLAHSPEQDLLEAAARKGVDLVLSGHTHGGQVCLPGGKALYAPGQGLNPPLTRGLHRITSGGQTTFLYINRGLGTSHLPLRLFSRPEVTIIKLVLAQ